MRTLFSVFACLVLNTSYGRGTKDLDLFRLDPEALAFVLTGRHVPRGGAGSDQMTLRRPISDQIAKRRATGSVTMSAPVALATELLSPIVMSLEKKLRMAPAPPPPRTPRGGGGGGDGDDKGFILKRLDFPQTVAVIEKWNSMQGLYELEAELGDSDRAATYAKEFAKIKMIGKWNRRYSRRGRCGGSGALIWGLYKRYFDTEEDDMAYEALGLAAQEPEPGCIISQLVLSPHVVGDERTTAHDEMHHALELAAAHFKVRGHPAELDLSMLAPEDLPRRSAAPPYTHRRNDTLA